MKVKELRQLGNEELEGKIEDFKKELFNLRFQAASHQSQNPKRAREVRRTIARIKTIQNERERERKTK
ncbi:MAG: 50S ribosomal protein L29 [bacterium]